MAKGSEPTKPGWYPHRYGDEGKQSYWDGSEWTGDSRPKPSLFGGSGAPGKVRNRGAVGWVLLAIGLGIFGSLVSGSRGPTAFDWALFAVTTLIWAIAAVRARSTVGRIVLWLWLVVQVFGWWLILGPGSSPVGEDITAAVISDIGVEVKSWGVSEGSWACVEAGLVEGGYTEDLADLPIRSLLLTDEDGAIGDVPPAFRRFREGLFLYLFDPKQGCLPEDEILAVQGFLTGVDQQQPPSDEAAEESIADVVDEMIIAAADGDIEALVQQLHPTTFNHWTFEECVSSIESIGSSEFFPWVDVRSVVFLGEGLKGLDYGQDRHAVFGNGYRVELVDAEGATHEIHVSLDQGGPYLFTNCDPPP